MRAYFTIFPLEPLDYVKYHPLIYLSQTYISDWKQINDTGLRSPEAGIKFCPGYQEPRASAYHVRDTGPPPGSVVVAALSGAESAP